MMCVFYFKYQNKINKSSNHFGIPYIGLENNIGIGQGFIRLDLNDSN